MIGAVALTLSPNRLVGLNVICYAVGWLVSWRFIREERIAATLSTGMQDFAVAAALLVGAGFPAAVTLPVVAFGSSR